MERNFHNKLNENYSAFMIRKNLKVNSHTSNHKVAKCSKITIIINVAIVSQNSH